MAYEIDYRPAALNELNGLEVWLQAASGAAHRGDREIAAECTRVV